MEIWQFSSFLETPVRGQTQSFIGRKQKAESRKEDRKAGGSKTGSGIPRIPKNPNFLKNGKNNPKQKNSKTSRDMPKLAIYPLTIGL